MAQHRPQVQPLSQQPLLLHQLADLLLSDVILVRVLNVAEKILHCHQNVQVAWSTTITVNDFYSTVQQIRYHSIGISDTIERRCCWWACGPSNTVTDYNGNPTYFCSSDKCNGVGSENILPPPSNDVYRVLGDCSHSSFLSVEITTAVTTATSSNEYIFHLTTVDLCFLFFV